MSRTRSDKLTEKQAKILEAVREYIRWNDCFPSMRDIGEIAGIRSTSHISHTLDVLEERRLIDRSKGKARSIHLPPPDVPPNVRRVPILGRIQAGIPLHIPDFSTSNSAFDSETYIDVLNDGLPKSDADCYYALEVMGDSMIDAHVLDGDRVILRATSEARNGQMVAARLSSGEVTLKSLYREKDTATGKEQVRLQPANKAYQPIIVAPDQVMVQGVVVKIERNLDY